MIVVNGDSFVHEFHLPIQERWSTNIGADLNLAIGAGSNDRTFYTTLQVLQEKNVDVLIIGWTHWIRSYLNKSNGSRYKICAGRASDEYLGDGTNDAEVAELFYKKIYNEFTQLKNTLMYISHLQEYCEMKKIKLINFATVFDGTALDKKSIEIISKNAFMERGTPQLEQQGIQHNKDVLQTYIDRLDPDHWINNTIFSSMVEILSQFPKVNDGHIGKEGSKKWAEIVQEHIS